MSIKSNLSLFGLIFCFASCSRPVRDFPEIAAENVLHVATVYNSTDSIADDMLRYIAQRSGLTVKISPGSNLETGIQKLREHVCDLIAVNITITNESKKALAFTIPLAQSKLMLVQRIPKDGDTLPLIRNQMDLAHRTITVIKNSSAVLRLHHLSDEIAEPITIHEETKFTQEQLMYLVANRYIDYAVVDQAVVLQNAAQISVLDVATDIGFTQWQAWAVRKNSPVLLDSLNVWIAEYQYTGMVD
jgi:membrane-bound lytic murein transglycosylase MltF